MKKDFIKELAELIIRKQSPVVMNGTDSERQTKRTQRTQKGMIAIFAKTVSNAPIT